MEELLQLGPVGIARLAAARQAIPAPLAASGLGSGHSWLFPHPQGGLWGGGGLSRNGAGRRILGSDSAGGENRPGTQPALLVSRFHRQQIRPRPPWKEELFGNKTCTWHTDPETLSWCTSLHPTALAGWAAVPEGPQVGCDRPHHPVPSPAHHSGSSSQILGYARGVEVAAPCLAL